ncbi:MAG TPA: adenine methyltransferase [Acholeplasma sp.]|nr:adenine methyltransferase [Acholeplasma sp.]
MFSSKSDEWETPQDLFNSLNDEFHFTLDPCSTHENHKCDKYYTQEDDGLSKDWAGETVFCNPPYGRSIGKWVEKCYKESLKGSTVVMLIPSRTDTKWFHKYIYNKAEIRFLKGRLKFINRALPSWNEQGNYKLSPAPFPSMIVIFKPNIQ